MGAPLESAEARTGPVGGQETPVRSGQTPVAYTCWPITPEIKLACEVKATWIPLNAGLKLSPWPGRPFSSTEMTLPFCALHGIGGTSKHVLAKQICSLDVFAGRTVCALVAKDGKLPNKP